MGRVLVKTRITKTELPRNFFSAFKSKNLLLANSVTEKAARAIAREAKVVIRKQKFNWRPLSDSYKSYKRRQGLDERILVATKDYVNNGIGVWTKTIKSKRYIFVGPKSGVHKPSGIPYSTLGKWFEFGTTYMPARQLWRPLLSKIIRQRKAFARSYRAGIKRALLEASKGIFG